jgi:Domain of unknown function (DUF4397)/Bacterial SH3 domain
MLKTLEPTPKFLPSVLNPPLYRRAGRLFTPHKLVRDEWRGGRGVRFLNRFLVALFLILLFLALSPSPQNAGEVSAQAAVNTGSLRVVNGLAGIGAVDVYLDNQRVAFGLATPAATTYFEVAAGRHALAVRPVNSDPLSAPIADVLIDLAANGSQTAVVYQQQFATGEAVAPPIYQSGDIFVMNDDRSPIQLGKTRLTAVHLAVGTPQRLSLGYPSGEALLYQIGLQQPFGTIDLEAGAYSVAVLAADSPAPTVLERLGEINFYANTLYTLVVLPDVQPSSDSSVVGTLSAQTKTFVLSAPLEAPSEGLRLRIVHAAHNFAVIDIYIDEQMVASRVSYNRFTEYLGLADYSHLITIRRFGAPLSDPPLGRATLSLTPENLRQRTWTLLLVNTDSQTASQPVAGTAPDPNPPTIINSDNGAVMMKLLPDNLSETRRGFARVRLINAANGVPPLSLFTPALPVSPPLAASQPQPDPTRVPPPGVSLALAASFGQEASEGEIPAGLYERLNFIPTGSINPLVSLANLQLVGGVVYTFVVMGSPGGNPVITPVLFEDYGSGLPTRRVYTGIIVIQPAANIRERPSTQAALVTQLPKDTEVEVLGRNAAGDWLRIRFISPRTGSVQEGWISATNNLIRVERAGETIQPADLPEYIGQ